MTKVFGPTDERSLAQLQTCIDTSGEVNAIGVLCGDHHPGYSMPIGGVLALQEHVIPAGVGFDIACGNCAVRTDIKASDIDTARVMDEIWKVISFGVGRVNGERITEHQVFDTIARSPVIEQRDLLALAQQQLGTVGSGNHYVDLFEERETGLLWVGVHFGSRGFGHRTASGFLAIAAGHGFNDRVSEGGMDSAPLTLPLNQPSGWDYLEAMNIAGEYAYAGRNWVVDRVLKILGGKDTKRVHNHHNFAWEENHGGHFYWVIRKGATPAFPGQEGFVGGTMGEDAVILEGVDSPASREALYSTVHGAGRLMGRREAAGKTKTIAKWRCSDHRKCSYAAPKGGYFKEPGGPTPKCPECGHKLRLDHMTEIVKPGKVDWASAQARVKSLGIELRGAGADEAPECYKRLPEVLSHHEGTVKITSHLRPVGVAMAGADVYDPYKD